MLLYCFFIIFSLAVLSIILDTWRLGISPMPSSRKAKQAIVHFLKNQPRKSYPPGKIYDLGSGWGGILRELGAINIGRPIVGYEGSWIVYWLSKCLSYRLSKCLIKRQNFFTADLSDAAIIICYLYPKAMSQLQQKFRKELQKGTIIISNTFALHEFKPIKVIPLHDIYHSMVYVYRIES